MKTTTHMLLYLLVIHLGLVQGWAQSERPNILFILSDDQAPWALGASGNADAHTPNLDELAKQGAYLVNAYVTTPVCSPSRVSIMTSRYASEFAILDFIPHPGHRLYDPDYAPGLAPESITFAEILQQAGYTTGLVGKWHLGDWTRDESNIYHPTKHGFSQFMGLTGGGTSAVDPTLEKDGISQAFKGLTSDILADQAIDFIEKNLASPFLLCYHTRAPHAPWLPVSEADWENFRDMTPILPNPQYPDLNLPKLREELRQYYASVSALDRNVGRVMDALVKNGLMENTIVIFFSDHGYNFGHHGIKHKGNGIWMTYHLPAPTPNIQAKYRPNLYENSLKVPAMVVWPPVVEKGLRIYHTVSSLDLFPTMLEMAGVEPPPGLLLRGKSFLPLLRGDEVEDWDDDFYAEYSMINYSKSFMRSYMADGWKLVIDFLDSTRNELYHLAFDPEENINLIDYSSEEIDYMKGKLSVKILERMSLIQDPLWVEMEMAKD